MGRKKLLHAHEVPMRIIGLPFEESSYRDGSSLWDAETLVNAVQEQGCEVYELPLFALDISRMPWNIENMRDVMFHMKRVEEADLKYPIIVDPYGYICDGWHRVAKAMLAGKRTIKAQRLHRMPEADRSTESE